ncbi:hypothetical protein Tco_1160653 [Tanacetum coccineum]
MTDAKKIADSQEGSDSDLYSMPDDDLASVSRFETAYFDNEDDEVFHSEHTSKEEFDNPNASTNLQSLSDHLDPVCEEVNTLYSKVADIESSIIHKVSEEIKSFVPALISNALKVQLPGLLSATLKDCLPRVIKEYVHSYIPLVSEQVADKQIELNKKMTLTKVLKIEMGQSITSKVRSGMHEEFNGLLESAVIIDDTTEREKKQPPKQMVGEKEQTPHVSEFELNEDTTLVLHDSLNKDSVELTLVENDSDDDDLDKQPLLKRFKIVHPIPKIPTPTPLNIVIPEHIVEPLLPENQPLPEILPKAKKLPLKNLRMEHYLKRHQGASQREMKRLADLKGIKGEIKEKLKRLLNPDIIKAQKWEEHEAKKAKMLEELNKCIYERTNPLPLTKISYIINSRKIATMRITRGNDPLNLTIYPDFRLKIMGFSEWLEVHTLASKKSSKSIDLLLQSLKAKFQWVLNQAKKLGLPPPPALATFGMLVKDKRRKRAKMIKHVFVKEDVVVDGSQRNIIPPPGVVGRKGLKGIEDQLSIKLQLAVKGLSECKPLESNIRCIQVKDINQGSKEYLKTFTSSAGMDISCSSLHNSHSMGLFSSLGTSSSNILIGG